MSGERSREIRQLQKAKDKAQRSGSLKEEAAVCNQLGEILARHGRYREALEEHRQELELLASVDDVIGCAVAHRKIGERLAELENYDAALKHQRQHLQLACALSHHTEQQRAWATIGRTYMFMAESGQAGEALQEAEKAFRKSLAILEEKLEGTVPKRELSEMRTRLYLNLGLVYDSMKDQAMCSHYIRKSIYISEQTGLSEDLYRAYFNLGNIHLRAGEHSPAMRCLERARECAHNMQEKGLESECWGSIAQVLLGLGDFAAARRALKKAYVLGSQQQRDSVRRSLRYAMKVSQLQESLEEVAPGDSQAALALCEQLGDLFSKHGDYLRALESYERQLRYAESLQKPEQELAVIHVSLAATYGDLQEHGRAVEHYQAELALRHGNPLEEGKTWLNIALAREEAGKGYAELEPCFKNALQSAELAGAPRLQRQILRHLHAVQQKCGCPEAPSTQTRLQELCRAHGWSPAGDSGEEEEELESSEPAEESDLELSESDGEENDLDGYKKSVPSRRRINKWNRRNDRGETPLHRACIDGNLRQAQYFVEQGHPLNPRDYCGWTPLHEACNHGHVEIVRLLLDRGASIDDPGGPGCEGITPLHDALNCGHFDVAELLLQRGASAVLRNAKGLSPQDTLQEWVRMYGKDLDQETRRRCRAMERLLKEAVAGRAPEAAKAAGHSQLFDMELSEPLSPHPSAPAEPPQDGGHSTKLPIPRRRPSPGGGMGLEPCRPECGDEQVDGMVLLRPVKKRQRLLGPRVRGEGGSRTPGFLEQEEPELARGTWAEYQAAIRSVGSAQSRLGMELAPSESPARPALIPADEYVEDDWLEDDLGVSREPLKRSRQCRRESDSDSGDATGPESDGRAPCLAPTQGRRARQSRLTQIVDRTVLGRSRGARALGNEETAARPTPLDSSWASDLGSSKDTAQLPSLSAGPAPLPPIRVRVRVQDNVFLIPVPHSGRASRPVAWLAEQAAERYYQVCGLLPRLTLKKEGALLAAQDLIADVLQSNEEVFAEVQSWDLPPLADRYRKACRSLAVGEHRLLLKISELQESGPSFNACGLSLRQPHLTPLLRALKLQTCIRQLRLAGNGLDDGVATELLGTLATLPSLALLDLSANQLGANGLGTLAAGLPGQTAFPRLEELDLSLNPLGDSSCQALACLVQACPVLSTLRLQACGFTEAFLQHYRLLLANSLKGAVHLKTLTLSHNALGSTGLEQLLRSLPCATLGQLEISSVAAPRDEPLMDLVVRYLTQEGCALTHLTLSGNCLSDEAVGNLARCLLVCPSLGSLDLSANPGITIVGLRMLLSALGERNQGLRYLSLAGCRVQGPVDSTTWARLSANVCDLRLCGRELSRTDHWGPGESWHSPPGTALRAVTQHRKLFCKSV